MKKHIANIITSFRIVCSVLLLLVPAYSTEFYVVYTLGGISDMLDGAVARMTNNTTKLGAQLDTIADFIFIVASFGKLLPSFQIPQWLWIWITIIAIIKLHNIILGVIQKNMFISLHTKMNKITGLLLYLLPFTISFIELKFSSIAVCSIATCAAIQKGHLIKSDK